MLKKINLLAERESLISRFILVFTILPFLILCFFNVPLGDDFWYARAYIENGFIETQVQWFNDWSGRYMATFAISSLNPLSFGQLKLAFIHPLLLITGTVFSFRLLVNNAIETFKLELNRTLVLSVILFFYFNYLPDFGETFYWMAGAYTYQLPVIFFVLYLNSLIHLFQSEKQVLILKNSGIAIFCLIIILGSNEVIVVYLCFVNTLILLVVFLMNKKAIRRFLPLFVIALALSITMIFAPGNFSRGALFERQDFHIVKSIFNAFARGCFVMVFWLPSLAFILLLIPNIYRIKIPNLIPSKLDFLNKKKLVFLGPVFLIFVLFIGFFPSIYTTKWIPQRAYTPIFFIFMLFGTVLIFIAINKIQVLSELNKMLSNKSATSFLLFIAIITLAHNSNVMNAYVDLTSGKANSYNKQVMAAYKLLETTKKDTVYIIELEKKPLILPVRWPSKHNRLVNNEWEKYFKVKRVEIE